MSFKELDHDPQALSPEQRGLLEAILLEEGSDWNAFPLSSAQQRLWFLDQLDPGSPAYNIAGAIELSGPLDRAALAGSLDRVVERHEVLRTSFVAMDGRPLQVIGLPAPRPLPFVDLTGLPAPARQAVVACLARAEARRGFDLAAGPLLRCTLLCLRERLHLLLLSFHHIVSDGWSSRIFARDLGACYEELRGAGAARLPELPIQYADYATWQNGELAGDALGPATAACLQRLAGLPPLSLPTDRPRPVRRGIQGSRLPVALAPEGARALAALCGERGATLFGGLLAVFQLLLARLSGQVDVAVGSPSANRDRIELEELVGCFVNTLVLRTDLSGDPTFLDLLGRVREVMLEAQATREVPFERLVDELEPERDLSRPPLVQVMLAFQGDSLALRLGDLDLRLLEVDNGTAKLDLLLSLVESPGGLTGYLEYDTDLFDATTVRRLLGHFESLLAGAVESPERRLGELPLLVAAERHQVLVEWNERARAGEERAGSREEERLEERIAARVRLHPEAVALIAGREALSYTELWRRAEEVADRLARQGLGPEGRVGIFLDRSVEMVAGLVGTLLAGGAYVPLDPAYPAERVGFMLADSGAEVVLSRASLAGRLPASAARVLLLDRAEEEPGTASPRKETREYRDGGQLAYVIYTSGSTGRPKGVAIEHRSALALIDWAGEVFGPEELSGLVAATSISFDLSVFELFVPLCLGGRVLLAESALEVPRLEALAEARLLNTVPSVLAELLRAGSLPPGVRTVNLAGEALPGALVRELYGSGTVERVYNLYGPSEATTYSTGSLVGPDEIHPPIGRPVRGTRAYVLDGFGGEAVLGVEGELYLGGAGLARGYLGRPELTAERFVPDGLSGEPGARLYRTGDVVRYRPDGQLDYLGRRDQQVKVRGFRIELGEVEAALAAHPGVLDCAVVASGEASGPGLRLVAFVVPAEAAAGEDELRQHLRRGLPAHMVPSVLVPLGALPQTASGKLDRRELARLAAGAAATAEHPDRAPRTPVEELLAGIWESVLGVERVGMERNFFELGGHSLLAVRVVARVGTSLGVDLAVRDLFERPTVAELAALVEERLRPEGKTAVAPPLRRIARTPELPLSFAQERLWLLDRLESGPAYNMPLALRLAGPLSVPALRAALDGIVQRHEILRTCFPAVEGRAVQAITAGLELPLPVVDLADLAIPAGALLAAAERLAAALARRPFDLAVGPLVRGELIRLGAGDHLLLLNLHHIVADGWSLGVLMRELEALYRTVLEGCPDGLAPLPVQYADYAVWQREWLAGGALEDRLARWRERLAGMPEALNLPFDRPRPAVLGFRGGRCGRLIAAPLAGRIEVLGRSEGTTLFMSLLAAFTALLARCCSADDVVVGSPSAGRGRPELEGLIGCFVNPLVLRLDLAGLSFRGTLLQAREVALDAYTDQDLPFERLVEALGVPRTLSYSPLFQVMLVLQNVPLAPLTLPGIEAGLLELDGGTAKLDLTLAVLPSAAGLATVLEYNTDLFDATTVRRLLGHFESLLAGAVESPERRLGELPLLVAAERHQVLVEWNERARAGEERAGSRAGERLEERIAARVRLHPEAAALIAGREALSYTELWRRAEEVADRLARQGLGPEGRVGIFLDRSVEMVAGLVGTLLAGGAYVPLDPAYPAERVGFMLADSGAEVVLSRASLAGRLPASAARVLLLDRAEEEPGTASPRKETREYRDGGQLAYVIYTSGSTGRPKGVAIEHRSALALIDWAGEVFGPEELSGLVAATSISFDLSVFELFVPLCLGGRVLLAESALEVPRLEALAEARLLNTVPSVLAELLRAGSLPPGVRTVNLAGEALPGALVRELYGSGTVERVYNLYGPSEATTYSTGSLVGPDEIHPPIGRPVRGTRAYVLDGFGGEAVLGVEGELYLGGAGLARGYLGRPELTAERFVPDGLSGEPGARLYRTGDVVRYRPDGQLDYLGRRDQQVKVRGFRIELGEVEAALAAHPGVLDCAVVASGEASGPGLRLVAFVVPAEAAAGEDELRQHLRRGLPAHMVPSVLVPLGALPQTASGKLDRRELARLAAGAAATAEHPDRAPRTPVEELLAGIWESVLGVERVGMERNFFELGGHSLLAVRVVARVGTSLGVDLAVRDLFERPTVAELAALVEERLRPEGKTAVAPPLRRIARTPELPLSFAQERLWLLDRLESGPAYNMPLALRLAGPLSVPALRAALDGIVQRHEILRTRLVTRDGVPHQVIDPPPPLSLPLADLSALPDGERQREAERLASAEALQPFDLARGPIFRALLVRLDSGLHHLLATVHHVGFDGWSLSLLLSELGAFYAAALGGGPPLPELPIQYADYAAWQRARLDGETLTRLLGYWRDRLAGAPAYLDLPQDGQRPASHRFTGARVGRRVSPELARALHAVARESGATLFMTLLAAFALLLSRLSGQEELVVGAPVAERSRPELEELIGVFLNTLALRLDLGGDPSFLSLLGRVREATLGAYTHQDLPFERLLLELQPERHLVRTPLFQVFLNMLSFAPATAELPGLSVELLTAPTLPAKFDLTLYARPEVGGEIALDLVYNADLWSAERAAEVADQLLALLAQVAAAPEAPVSTHTLITARGGEVLPDPTRALVAGWPGSPVERLARHAAESPSRPALRDAAGTWSYGELEARSNQLAHALLSGGIGRGDVVAIYGHRGAALVGALLGTWKAGAAFLLLDPSYPVKRQDLVLRIARPAAWLVLEAAGLPPAELSEAVDGLGCRIRLTLPATVRAAMDDPLQGFSVEAPPLDTAPDDLAYLVFTSGSTGTPKGVLGTHRPLAHFLAWHTETFGLRPEDRFALLSGLAHDPLLRDVLTPLWLGAALAIPEQDDLTAPGRLRAWMEREAVSVAHLTPALAQLLVTAPASAAAGRLPALRWAFFGGDVLTPAGVERLREIAPAVACVNFYGATETPQAMSHHLLTSPAASPLTRQTVPLGRGIDGVQLLVLNSAGRLAGIGELGEICVRSPYLSLGYRDDPELTLRRFVQSPFSGLAGDRLYRTGDLGRYLPDGEVELAGRADAQIKLHGFRIEPAEVEVALLLHPTIRQAVVGVCEDGVGERAFVAWITCTSGTPPEAAEVQALLRRSLPAYMIPSFVVPMAELPLTPNGKIDKRALPPPRPAVEAGPAGDPRDALEASLTELWAEVLGTGRVGIHDSFFTLGGHSLLATRLLARIEDTLGVAVPLRVLFERSTVAELAGAVTELRQQRASAVVTVPGRLPVAVPAPEERHLPFPLTDIQHAYWVGRSAALELGGVASHRYLEIDCADLDLGRFTAAWQRLVERHDMLRALVRADGMQIILASPPPYEVVVEDLRDRAPELIERRLLAIRERMSHQVMATDRWPLFEIRAARTAAADAAETGRVRLFLSFDYLLADAWSFRILIRELLALYGDPAVALPPLELSFRDYVLATEELRQGDLYRRSRDYWRARAEALPPGPELPLARPLAARESLRFSRRVTRLGRAEWQRLQERAAHSGVTASAVLLAAFSQVLATWSKEPRFTLVLTLFNRLPLHPAVDRLVGDFTSTTLLAVDAAPGEAFLERVRRLQQRLWEDLDHRYVSGVEVLRELGQGRGGPGRVTTPVVFTSTLGLGGLARGLAEANLPGQVVHSVAQTPQVLLDHQVGERGGELMASWDAVDDLFPEGVLDAMFAAYQSLLGMLAAAGDPAWDRLPSLVPAEQLALVAEVNATQVPFTPDLLHTLFIRQALAAPERPAVIVPGGELSYGELRRRASHLARQLRDLGVRPGRLVAVVMEKGWEQVVAVLAILEAGAAYLPIDASLPQHRLDHLLERGEVEIVLTQDAVDGRYAWPGAVRRLAVRREEVPDLPPLPPVQRPEDLAYVIFTSGSTGMPKGVMIDHQGAVNTVLDINRRFAVGPEDRVFALSALSFDLSVYDIFGALAMGAAVVLPDASDLRDPACWVELMRSAGVTVWDSVPALLEMLVDYAEMRREPLPGALRVALLSGDWIPVGLPARVRALRPEIAVISLGGATEASIWSICFPIAEVDPAWKSIPYGQPLANQSFFALDEALASRPLWVTGALWIGGVGVAQGYWRDEERTAASFVTHPRTGERLYRTGDLGRLLPDGNLEFLGREDQQVKVHGYRIELGEIEAVLAEHPAVRAAVVKATGGGTAGPRRLVAYVVAEEAGGAPAAALRELLLARLPEYMMPATFVELASLPLSANGKVDRSALLDPPASAEVRPVATAELSPLARRVTGVIGGVLKRDTVDLEADLFMLGASSVEMVRIANLLEVELGFRPKMDELLGLSRIAALVEFYEQRLALGDDFAEEEAPSEGALDVRPITDPGARARFRESEPGRRRFEAPGQRIPLAAPEPTARHLARRSTRVFVPQALPLDRCGRWLACLGRATLAGKPKYRYGSAGGLYPVQLYLVAKPQRINGLAAGAYYFDPAGPELVPLGSEVTLDRSDFGWVNQPTFDRAAFAVFLIGDLGAIAPMYGGASRDFCLVEAGLMTQLLEEEAIGQRIGLCQVGRCRTETLRSLLRLGPRQVFLHGLLGGGLTDEDGNEAAGKTDDGVAGWEEGEL